MALRHDHEGGDVAHDLRGGPGGTAPGKRQPTDGLQGGGRAPGPAILANGPPRGALGGLSTDLSFLDSILQDPRPGDAVGGLPGVQSFTESEHFRMGDKAASAGQLVDVAKGYACSYGDIVAMAGDWFESFDELAAMAADDGKGPGTREEVEYIRIVEIHGHVGSRFPADVKAAANARYERLAGGNRSHFVNARKGDAGKPMRDRVAGAPDPRNDHRLSGIRIPPKPANAVEAYRYYHLRAIIDAVERGGDQKPLGSAMAIEGFGAHYLSDSFSAGHVRTERASIKEWWDDRVPLFFHNLKAYMSEAIARTMEDNGGYAADVSIRPARPTSWIEKGIGEIIDEKVDPLRPVLTLGNLVSGAIHSYDNQHGVLAKSGGADVELFGDHKAGEGDEQRLAIAAMSLGLLDLHNAHAAGMAGRTPQDVIDSLVGSDGLFAPERLIPQVKPDSQQGPDQQKIRWDYPDVAALFGNPQFAAAAALVASERAKTILDLVGDQPDDVKQAIRQGVVNPLLHQTRGFMVGVANFTPTIRDPLGVRYVGQVRAMPGGLRSLVFPQRQKLIAAKMGNLMGDGILEILTTATDDEARRLILQFTWQRLHKKIDSVGDDFAKRFPQYEYSR